MSRKKLRKCKTKCKHHQKEDKSKILDCTDEHGWPECEGARGEEVRAECEDRQTDRRSESGRRERSARQVHIALLPDRYEPLEEQPAGDTEREEGTKTRKAKYKKFRKNVGKAVRYSWKCLVVGLQSFSLAYSGPLSTAATLVPEIPRTRPTA